jgi:hypothetical protein
MHYDLQRRCPVSSAKSLPKSREHA